MTIETYAERLQKRKEEKMSNYDMDEIERQKEREQRSRGIKPKAGTQSVEIELSDDDLLILTLAAHDRDITLNQLCNSVLADSLENLDYRFEHQTKPTVLKEY